MECLFIEASGVASRVPSGPSMPGDELHLVSMVNHRLLNASIYGSVAVLKSKAATLSKTHMSIRATSLGVATLAPFLLRMVQLGIWPFACVVHESKGI